MFLSKNISLEQADWLQEKWFSLAGALSLPQEVAKQLFEEINTKYQEKHRAYHNLSHIYNMLQLAGRNTESLVNPKQLELAIWYHDIIYKSSRKDNERRSAVLMAKRFSAYCPVEMLEKVAQMIDSTKQHIPIGNNPDTPILLDLDLAILAAERSVYARYAKAIREEYRIYPDLLYKPGRKKVLQHFLGMDFIYYNEINRKNWEVKARENLAWELG